MAVIRKGNATPEKREGRIAGTLTASDPRFESLVAGLGIDGTALHQLRIFAKEMAIAAGRFQIARRQTGLFGTKRLSKVQAAHALQVELAKAGVA